MRQENCPRALLARDEQKPVGFRNSRSENLMASKICLKLHQPWNRDRVTKSCIVFQQDGCALKIKRRIS
jgi:hypothetical protein